jgi:hypothetical protein
VGHDRTGERGLRAVSGGQGSQWSLPAVPCVAYLKSALEPIKMFGIYLLKFGIETIYFKLRLKPVVSSVVPEVVENEQLANISNGLKLV